MNASKIFPGILLTSRGSKTFWNNVVSHFNTGQIFLSLHILSMIHFCFFGFPKIPVGLDTRNNL